MNNTETNDNRLTHNLFEHFEEEIPSSDFTKKTMSMVLTEWSKQPAATSRFSITDYIWHITTGIAIILAIVFYPSQLGLDSDSHLMQTVTAMAGQIDALLGNIQPVIWSIVAAGILLRLLDNILRLPRKI